MIEETEPAELASWIKRSPGQPLRPVTVVFPHAGGAAAAYRAFASALSRDGGDAFVVQYPQRSIAADQHPRIAGGASTCVGSRPMWR